MIDLIWQNVLLYWKSVLEILLLWSICYAFLYYVRGTLGVQLLKGLAIIVLLFIVTQQFQLRTINWILTKLLAISVIAVLILFQPELRRALSRLGQHHFFKTTFQGEMMIQEILQSCTTLSQRKIGALIVIQKEVGLKPYIESGILLDCLVTSEVLNTIFMPNTPLHDGAVILENGRIASAGCLLPLTQNPHISRSLGTRHRAAIGLTEETDAVVVVVSEENGAISIASRGQFSRDMGHEELANLLRENLYNPQEGKKERRVVRS